MKILLLVQTERLSVLLQRYKLRLQVNEERNGAVQLLVEAFDVGSDLIVHSLQRHAAVLLRFLRYLSVAVCPKVFQVAHVLSVLEG